MPWQIQNPSSRLNGVCVIIIDGFLLSIIVMRSLVLDAAGVQDLPKITLFLSRMYLLKYISYLFNVIKAGIYYTILTMDMALISCDVSLI